MSAGGLRVQPALPSKRLDSDLLAGPHLHYSWIFGAFRADVSNLCSFEINVLRAGHASCGPPSLPALLIPDAMHLVKHRYDRNHGPPRVSSS